MKKVFVFFSIVALSFSVSAQEDRIDSKLKTAMNSASDSDFIGVIIELSEQPQFSSDVRTRAEVLTYLQEFTSLRQDPIRRFLTVNLSSKNVETFKPYYIFNGLYAKCQKAVIEKLSQFASIARIHLDEVIKVGDMKGFATQPVATSIAMPQTSPTYWWNIRKIGTPKVRDNLSIDGSGVLIGIIDEGFSGNHPDLVPRWKSQYGWIDYATGSQNPIDSGSGHGTAVTGIIVAGDNSGDEIGVAPGAQFISAKAFQNGSGLPSDVLDAMEWMLDPDGDGNPNTGQEHVPDVVNNSWGGSTYDTYFWAAVDSWIAAGIFPAFIAHNYGPNPSTVTAPGSYPQSFCVGGVDSNDVIGSYSGRGPVTWNSVQYIKPDVVAPCEPAIKFCVPTDQAFWIENYPSGYIVSDGRTSTAGPHVTGIVALIKQAAPSLSISDIKAVTETGAKDLGSSGKDNNYGSGRIDVYQSVLHAYAYSNKSVSSTATASNNGRRMVKTSDNRYHLVFESGITSSGNVLSEIFYRRSNSGGTSWETPTRLSGSNEQNRYPSIAERVDGSNKKLYVVWQRKTGTNTYDILFRHFNGSSWDATQTITSGVSLTSDPLPVIAISTPSPTAFEMMVVYRTNSGLKSRRSTNISGISSSWASEVTVTSSTSARNPSIVYRGNDYAYFQVSWDNSSHVYYRKFFGSSWSNEATVSLNSSANTHEYSSFAIGSTYNRHIAWQATDPTQGNRKVILHNLDLNSTIFTKFYSASNNYQRPNVTGIGSGGAFVFWHEASANKIRYAKFNGSYWEGNPPAGTVYGSNGIDASAAAMNPPASSIKAVWRSSGSSPYTLSLGTTLNKSTEIENIVYSRQLIYASLSDSSVLALRLFAPQITGENKSLEFPAVANDDSLVAESLAEKLTFDFVVPARAEDAKLEVEINTKEAAKLLQSGASALQVGFELIDPAQGSRVALASIESADGVNLSKSLTLPLASLTGKSVRLRPVLAGLDLGKVRGALVHEYGLDETRAPQGEALTSHVASSSYEFSVHAKPNPFNPSTNIQFTLPAEGMVKLRIYNLQGQLVCELLHEQRAAGAHTITWDGRNDRGGASASGIYFLRLQSGKQMKVSRLTLVR